MSGAVERGGSLLLSRLFYGSHSASPRKSRLLCQRRLDAADGRRPLGDVCVHIRLDGALLHFPPSAVANYVRELARVLRPGGAASLHHGNMPLCTESDPCRPKLICRRHANGTIVHIRGYYGGVRSCGITVQARKNPQARNAGTTCASVAALAAAHGLRVAKQEYVPWGGTRSLRHDAWDPATPPPRLPPTGIVD